MKANPHLLRLSLAAFAVAFAATASAAMYKWTDQEGNVQYSQTPPPEGDAIEISPPPAVKAPAPLKAPANRLVEDEENAAEKAPLTPEQQAVYQRNCEAARANLDTYRTATRVQQADGQIVDMNDENRQTKIQQAEEQVKKFCR